MLDARRPWEGVLSGERDAIVAKNREKMIPREVAVQEVQGTYVYSFKPAISSEDIDRIYWNDLMAQFSNGFTRKVPTKGGAPTVELYFSKSADSDAVEAVFRRLSGVGLVDIKITNEQYPSRRRDEEKKWAEAKVIMLGPDEYIGSAYVYSATNGKAEKGIAIIRPKQYPPEEFLTDPPGTYIKVMKDGEVIEKLVIPPKAA